jgi:S1-C subfamily serine protease
MPKGQLWAGAGWVRRLRATCAMALTLVAAGIAAGKYDSAEASGRSQPLDYHATVVNGPITGSSFQIADGIVLTNAHVVGSARPGSEMFLLVDDGRRRMRARARVLAVSSRMDVALLKVASGLLPVAPRADAPLGRGRPVRAAGVVAEYSGPGPRLELGGRIASDVLTLRPFGPGLIAEMPGIRRGFSGGPVFDGEGRLVGMVAALRPDPDTTRSATGDPLAGQEAFVLSASAIRAEAARLLAEAGTR